jgi:hypothetical protein
MGNWFVLNKALANHYPSTFDMEEITNSSWLYPSTLHEGSYGMKTLIIIVVKTN